MRVKKEYSHFPVYDETFHVMGIDLSKAFDCLYRTFILEITNTLLDEDETRILTLLLSNTTLTPAINSTHGKKFQTIIGTPQGDSLSAILFIVYLEAVFRKHKELFPDDNETNHIQIETKYVDDCDFIAEHDELPNLVTQVTIPITLAKYNLQMNQDKTERTIITKENCRNIKTKKLGSLIGENADLKYRTQQAAAAFKSMWKIWLSNKSIKLSTRIKLYNACVKSILTYNIAAIGLNDQQANILNTTHRRHLRHILRVYHPNTISNTRLYEVTKSHPITDDMIKARW